MTRVPAPSASPGTAPLDDLLATGGTLDATARLIEMSGGIVASMVMVIELTDLGGRQRLGDYEVFSLIKY